MSQAMQTRPKVTKRPVTILPYSQMPIHGTSKRRVAAYARVSTDNEEQLTSYHNQVRHYTQYIKSREDWEFVDVYPDEGLSGLRLAKREKFNDMIADAKAGKIDLIITKSVSRFGRNTLDTIRIVRELKSIGVEVYFEKENIYTFDPKAELLLTILASLAQEESRSISENVTWGWRAKFAAGEFTLPYKRFLGYQKGADGKPEIIPEEAVIVRQIYAMFLSGKTSAMIAQQLTEQRIPTPSGKSKWAKSTIESILTNEKYYGDAVLQKTFTLDFIQGKKKINEGEVEQYHHSGTHEGIVSKATFEMVQSEIERRGVLGRSYSGKDPFSCRVVCGECGGLYGGKVWGSNTKYRRTIYRCNHKYEKGKQPCATPHFTEDEIKRAFLTVFNRMLPNRGEIIAVCREAMGIVMDTEKLEHHITKLKTQCEELASLIRTHINSNAHEAKDQGEYTQKYSELTARLEAASQQRDKAEAELLDRQRRCAEVEAYLDTLEGCGNIVTQFDEYLWNMVVDTVTIHPDNSMVFRLKDGHEMTWR